MIDECCRWYRTKRRYEFVADEDVARMLLRVDLFGDETEKLLLGLVVGAVGDAVQRVLMKNPLEQSTAKKK